MQELNQQLTDRSERLWLNLDLEGIEFHFRILKYVLPPHDWYYEKWCKVDFILKAGNWLNYRKIAREPFTSSEIEELRDLLDDLLNYRFKEDQTFTAIEPDYECYLHLWYDSQADPEVLKNESGKIRYNADMEMCINFWDENGALTCNKMILYFGEEDLEKLLCYLNFVTFEIDEEDEFLKELMEQGWISDYLECEKK